ncbi:MAG: thiamine pyrophosphate-dependent enzyme [Dehalococcoidia bacterium]|jgi:3D-(3,5/4)-trihydroxycyclohexane-1,2-dione acylhydrolase (decyclizing)
MKFEAVQTDREKRAAAIAACGGLISAVSHGKIPSKLDITVSEAVVLGLIKQNVRTFFAVFGHGSTDLAEVLRIYQQHGLVKVLNTRSEVEASHAATALRWVTDQKSAVITSIGPGALQALAASLVPASDGLGIWYILGDETTDDEGPNMQQIPRYEQDLFLRLFSTVGQAYSLHTPGAISTALRRGQSAVDHPFRAAPFFLLLPMNIQPVLIESFNLRELAAALTVKPGAAEADYASAADWLLSAKKVALRVGGGARNAGPEIAQLLDLVDGMAVISPLCSGIIPYSNPRNMTVGGSKGTLCGNYAMEHADLLLVIGSRFVCQSDCSRTAYLKVQRVININTEIEAALHYSDTLPLVGDARLTLQRLLKELKKKQAKSYNQPSAWFKACSSRRQAWEKFKQQRYEHPTLFDEKWKRELLTQPAAIKAASDWARAKGVVKFFDAGDVQANGFQIVEDEVPGFTFTDTGASYMGFAASALLATAASEKKFFGLAFTGDGSFTMNPQILIDGVQHGARGCILLLDNRRMSAITGLQKAQYNHEFATDDSVVVDYVALANAVKGVQAMSGGFSRSSLLKALDRAYGYDGLSLIHVPVYSGDNELGGMGVFGRWNVGNWCESTQALRHEIGL